MWGLGRMHLEETTFNLSKSERHTKTIVHTVGHMPINSIEDVLDETSKVCGKYILKIIQKDFRDYRSFSCLCTIRLYNL